MGHGCRVMSADIVKTVNSLVLTPDCIMPIATSSNTDRFICQVSNEARQKRPFMKRRIKCDSAFMP